jgi:hypothetical protein
MTRTPSPYREVLAAAGISTGLGVTAVILALANDAGLVTALITGGTTTGGAMALAMQILVYLRRP